MTPLQQRIQKAKFKKLRRLRTANPFCAICAENRWFIQFEFHHIAGKKYSNRTILICVNCHNPISLGQQMLEDFNDGPRGRLSSLIALVRGHRLIVEQVLVTIGETEAELAELQRLIDPVEPKNFGHEGEGDQ